MAGLGASISEEEAEGRYPGSGPGRGKEGCRVTEASPEMGFLADSGAQGFTLGVVPALGSGLGPGLPARVRTRSGYCQALSLPGAMH